MSISSIVEGTQLLRALFIIREKRSLRNKIRKYCQLVKIPNPYPNDLKVEVAEVAITAVKNKVRAYLAIVKKKASPGEFEGCFVAWTDFLNRAELMKELISSGDYAPCALRCSCVSSSFTFTKGRKPSLGYLEAEKFKMYRSTTVISSKRAFLM